VFYSRIPPESSCDERLKRSDAYSPARPGEAQVIEMAGLKMDGAGHPPSNLDRLKGLLKGGTLAERLVTARIAAKVGEEQAALRQVIDERLKELRQKHESVPDQQA
jgi:hypothetical protein